jgi:hypothetical protein
MVLQAADADAELWLSRAQRFPEVGAELQTPMPIAFVGHMVAGFEQDQPDVARTGAEDMILLGHGDNVDRSFERRLNPPQMCQLISMSPCAMNRSFR